MISGIPQYQSPIEQSLRCLCGVRYLVLMSDGTGDAESRARERAEVIKAVFINARKIPFMLCECGEFLDFTTEEQDVRMI